MSVILATLLLGAVVSSAIASFGARDRKYFIFYVMCGCVAALLHALAPVILYGSTPGFRPVRVAIVVCIVVGLAILFTSGKSRR